MKKNDIIILYHIDLEIYKKVKTKNYHHFSKSEITEKMLCGEVIILNEDKTLFSFEADLLKLFILFTNNLRKISFNEEQNNEIFSVYNDYHFSFKRYDQEYVNIIFNQQKKSLFNIKKLLHITENIKHKLLTDFKILYPDYQQLKNFDYLTSKINE